MTKKIVLVVVAVLLVGVGLFMILVDRMSSTPDYPVWYDHKLWREVKSLHAAIDQDGAVHQMYLLESIKPTGSTGLGDSLFDVRVLIIKGEKTIYDYLPGTTMPDLLENGAVNANKYYIDNTFELADLTGDHKPDLVFHSGYVGVSDNIVATHILVYDATSHIFIESLNPEFYNSFNHEMTMLRDRTIVVATPEPNTSLCRTCAQRFVYTLYGWNNNAFVPTKKLISSHAFEGSREALENDVDHDSGGVLKNNLKLFAEPIVR